MFCVSDSSIDEILRKVYKRLLCEDENNFRVTPTKGPITEVFGSIIELTNPRSRLSQSYTKGKLFSALGELLWYLSGSNKISFIEYYLPGYSKFSTDGISADGAYGPRIFGNPSYFSTRKRILEEKNMGTNTENQNIEKNPSQIERVIQTLTKKRASRNAVIQIFSNSDANNHSKDIPCTCTLQFAIREKKLFLHTNMRSNDVFRGLPHDIFSFTMIQEIVANIMECELGSYIHSVGSLHLYNDTDECNDETKAREYLEEGHFEPISMPRMPSSNLIDQISNVLLAEEKFRNATYQNSTPSSDEGYWSDIINLLHLFAEFKCENTNFIRVLSIFQNIHHSEFYNPYIFDKFGTIKFPSEVQ